MIAFGSGVTLFILGIFCRELVQIAYLLADMAVHYWRNK